MSQTPLLGTATRPSIPVTGASIGVVPPSPLTGTTVQDLIDELQAEIAAISPGLDSITDGTTTVAPVTSATVPLGGVTDNGGADAGLNFLTSVYGEQATLVNEPAAGATYAIDCSLGNTFDITLTANCAFSIINPPPFGVDAHIILILRQGGTGSYTVTWPASVFWQDPSDGTNGGSAPTLWTAVDAQDVVELSTEDGGVSWGGDRRGSGATSFAAPALTLSTTNAAGAATTAIRSDATVAVFDATVPTTQAFGDAAATGSAAVAARRDHVHGMPADPFASLPPAHAHVDNVVFSGDGSTTDFILPAAPVDAYSIGVYVTGSRSQDWTLTGALLDTLSFGSAPASATDNIVVDIAAAL